MDIEYFRSSSYNCFSLCEQQFFLSYVLGVPQLSNIKAEFGTATHKVLECLARIKKEIQQGNNSGIIEDVAVGKFSWREKTFLEEDMARALLDRVFDYYKENSKNEFTPTNKADIWEWLKIVFADSQFDPRKRTIFETEKYFDLEIDEPWAKLSNGEYLRLKGTIDLITEVDENTLEVVDWKTGAKPMNWADFSEKGYAEFRKDPQLLIYFYALSKLYSNKNIIITIYYIRSKGGFTLCFTEADVDLIKDMLHQQFDRIKKCTSPCLKEGGNSRFCRYICPYGKTKSKYEPYLSECQFFNKEIRLVGMENIIRRYTNKGHSLSAYEPPGI